MNANEICTLSLYESIGEHVYELNVGKCIQGYIKCTYGTVPSSGEVTWFHIVAHSLCFKL